MIHDCMSFTRNEVLLPITFCYELATVLLAQQKAAPAGSEHERSRDACTTSKSW
jgi:hypothetical protein